MGLFLSIGHVVLATRRVVWLDEGCGSAIGRVPRLQQSNWQVS
jgi:hypothetical protein